VDERKYYDVTHGQGKKVNVRRGTVAICCESLPSDGTETAQIARQFVTVPYCGEFLSALDTGN